MKKIALITSFIALSFYISGQNSIINFSNNLRNDNNVIRSFNDLGLDGIQIEYNFHGANVAKKEVDGKVYSYLNIKDFSKLKEVGKPALPCHNDIIAIPLGADVKIKIIDIEYKEFKNYLIHPALQPATDTKGAKEPDFEIDEDFYKQDVYYPATPVKITEIQKLREISMAIVEIRPVQYNPAQKKIRTISRIKYEIEFLGASKFIEVSNHSEYFKSMLPNYFLNGQSIKKEIKNTEVKNQQSTPNSAKNYIIITHTNYLQAAEDLAQWKRQLGYSVEIFSAANWTSSSVKTIIHSKYQSWTPKPDFFVIIGDHGDVPGEILTGSYGNFASDLYYACMNGSNDYVPDMANGRISVTSLTMANTVIQKIINYEKHPVNDTTIYRKALHAAYFQHAGSGYAQRRFAQTAEDARNYMDTSQNFNIERVYVTGNSVTPLYWNNGNYSAGEPLPSYLKKPTFPWNGNASHINAGINNGVLYVLHRDHGSINGWGDPAYNKSNINSLNNGIKTPIVFSINCLTGKFLEPECFSECFLRKSDGGAVGVFGHGEVSLSGYNDGLSLGLIDAIWANPGLVPNFTGSGGISNPNLSSHTSIATMGYVRNQALIRMGETWGIHKYTSELFNYFGDPAMKIWTDVPTLVTATNSDTIQCGNDSTFAVSNCTCLDAIATLVVDDELVGITQLVNGYGIINFQPVAGSMGILTISKHNYKPYVDTIVIAGGCPKSRFTIGPSKFCIGDSITFTNASSGTITSYLWNFGNGAVPATVNTIGPQTIVYSTSGTKTISLTVSGPNGNQTYTQDINIDQYCKYLVPASNNEIIIKCSGRLYDNGGTGDYSNNTDGSVTINPFGASTVTLYFNSFSFESGYDYLKIYDGPNTSSTLIGNYDGTSLPNGGIINSSGSSITIRQITDQGLTMPGFELDWICNMPNSAPSSNFKVSDSVSCLGIIDFTDQSSNGPSSWAWNFGDGNSSVQQNPTYTYTTSGLYNVKLITTNSFGSDSITKNGIVTINIPAIPVVPPAGRCGTGTVTIEASIAGMGTICWYDSLSSGTLLDTGLTYITPVLTSPSTTSYYVENNFGGTPKSGGKTDNTGSGGYLNSAHYLVFDCFKAVKLKSVKVYASGSKSRTITLRTSSGNVIQSKTVYVPSGQSRVELDFNIPVGVNLRLAAASNSNLYRNTNTSSSINFPYITQNILSIKHSSASSNPTGYYYYFYDWEIIEESCKSMRIPVNVVVSDSLKPMVDFSFINNEPDVNFTNSVAYEDSVLWNFGDGNMSTLENPTYVYSANGTYNVKLIAYNDCGIDSITKQVTIVSTSINNLSNFDELKVYPNPAHNKVNIEFNSTENQDLEIFLIDMLGQILWKDELSNFEGKYSQQINLNKFAKGVYYIKISSKSGATVRKLIYY